MDLNLKSNCLDDLTDQISKKQYPLIEKFLTESSENAISDEALHVKGKQYEDCDSSKYGTKFDPKLQSVLQSSLKACVDSQNTEKIVSTEISASDDKIGSMLFSSLKSSIAEALQNGVPNSVPGNVFLCSECPRTFETSVQLDEHFSTHEKLEEKTVSVSFKRRVKMKPSRLYPPKCSICQISFNSRNDYRAHSDFHSGNDESPTVAAENLTLCHSCGKNVSVSSDNIELNICDHCQQEFPQSEETANNIELVSENVPSLWDDSEPHNSLPKKPTRGRRRKLNSKLLLYNGYDSQDSQEILRSKRHSLEDKPYLCDQCGSRFHTLSNLERHNKVHTGERPFTCEICNKSYAYMHALKQHLRMHTQEKPYICEYCGKAFARRDYLKEHLRVHTKEKPYICKICGRGFSQSGSLKLHQKVHVSRIGET